MPVPAASVNFAEAALRLGHACRRLGLRPPAFRSPPSHPTATRTLRRRPDGTVIVAVRLRGRPPEAVVADLVEGVLAANRLAGPAGDATRRELLVAAGLPPGARAA